MGPIRDAAAENVGDELLQHREGVGVIGRKSAIPLESASGVARLSQGAGEPLQVLDRVRVMVKQSSIESSGNQYLDGFRQKMGSSDPNKIYGKR